MRLWHSAQHLVRQCNGCLCVSKIFLFIFFIWILWVWPVLQGERLRWRCKGNRKKGIPHSDTISRVHPLSEHCVEHVFRAFQTMVSPTDWVYLCVFQKYSFEYISTSTICLTYQKNTHTHPHKHARRDSCTIRNRNARECNGKTGIEGDDKETKEKYAEFRMQRVDKQRDEICKGIH